MRQIGMRMKIAILVFCLLAQATLAGDCDRVYKGRYYRGAEVNSFHPCNSESTYWVSASSWVMNPVWSTLRKQTIQPYQPIYLEFRGHLLDEVVDGFAADYNGLIRISEIYHLGVAIPPDCKLRQQ